MVGRTAGAATGSRPKSKTKTAVRTGPPPSRLQTELANRILRWLKEQGVGPGYHLIELELCQQFGVSRTPVRGALKLLAESGAVEARANRGFVLLRPVTEVPEAEPVNQQDEEDKQLLVAIAQARNTGALPAECAQQEVVRLFGAKLSTVVRVLRQLSELGLVERKAGNGWSFLPSIDSSSAQAESYAFRRIVEPEIFLQPTFQLDREWLASSRAQHMAFMHTPWRDVLALEFYDMNSDFHLQLARCSGNRYLFSAVQRQNRLRSFLNYHWVYGVERVRESIDEHLLIMDALEAGDNEKAAQLMRDHLTYSASSDVPLDKRGFAA